MIPGSLINAINIYNLLATQDVYTVLIGQCSGLSTLIFLAANENRRFALPYSTYNIKYIKNDAHFYENFKRNECYKEFAKEIFAKKLTHLISSTDTLKDIFNSSLEENTISSNELENLKIAKIISSFQELDADELNDSN